MRGVSNSTLALALLALTTPALVRDVHLGPAETEWLRALGLGAGQQVTVLRRAPWGGPLHVRTGSGGEFAVDRGLAHAIVVESVAENPIRAV